MRRSCAKGSPPRVRGKEVVLVDFICLRGITPACAGKSHSVTDANASSWDHPRVCGEKALQSSVNCTMEGSPPRMRGKGLCKGFHLCDVGITPAYAGKRRAGTGQWACRRDHPRVCGEKLRTSSRLSTSWDHPRVCGEKALSTFSSRKNSGSPPRVRGKGQIAPLGAVPVGITPACAGKRCVYSAQNQSLRDHPRVCGEKSPAAV